MRVQAQVLLAATAWVNLDFSSAAPVAAGDASITDFENRLCAEMVNGLFGKGTSSSKESPLCAAGAIDGSDLSESWLGNTYYCDIEVARQYTTTCAQECASIGYKCIATYDDMNGKACVVGDESSCDASLYSKICRCSGDTILTTRPAGAETSSSSVVDLSGDDPCSVNWAIQLRPDSAETTNFQLNIELESTAPAGVYTLSARARVQKNFDGTKQLLYSQWFDKDGNSIGTTEGGFPANLGTWETISVSFDTGSVVPATVQLYVGHPLQSTTGHVEVRQLSLLDTFNGQYIQGGDLACGKEPPQFSESESTGKFKIKDEELEPLCFVTKHDIDGMCGDMVQLSGSDGNYVGGQGFNAQACADACISFTGFECNGFAIDGDHDCHLFSDADECIVDVDEVSMDYYEMSRECGELITCQLTIDNTLDAVYFNNEDITSTITSASGDTASEQDLKNWPTLKAVSFRWDGVGTAVLAFAGHEIDDTAQCSISGLLLGCSSDNPDSDWNFVRSDTSRAYLTGWSGRKDEDPAEDDVGREWYSIDYEAADDWPGVCTSTSAFYCCEDGTITVGNGQVGLSAEKVWPCNCGLAAFFRIEVEGSEYKNIVNQDGANELVCDWEEEHPDKTLEGCTQDNCYDFKSLSEAKRACEGYGTSKCGGVSYNGAYETRLYSTLVDSPSGESSWLMTSCSERDYACADGIDSLNWSWDTWTDSLGYTCEQYAAYQYCTEDGEKGRGWDSDWGDFGDYESWCYGDNCYDATEVCCACGGGVPQLTQQECYKIEDAGECLSSYDSRSEYASPCCVIDSRVNGNSCEPQTFIEDEGLRDYATCTAWEGNAGWCPNSCLGENTCDYWIAFSDSFTCANLEQKMGCDCSGCMCPKTTSWRFVVNEVYGQGDQMQVTELSFVDQYNQVLAAGEDPVVKPGITSTDNIDGRLSDGSAAFEQQMNCDPLPCTFTYELTSEPSKFSLGYADSYDRLPSFMLVQYRDTKTNEWITTWAGEPEPPCGDDATYTDSATVCENLSVTDFDTEPLENCPSTCFGDYSCDWWIGAVPEFTCATLEHDHGCNCWQCGCADAPLTTAALGGDPCSWWSCEASP